MLFSTIVTNPVAKVFSTNATLYGRDLTTRDYTHWVIDTAGVVLTLPTPTKDLAGKIQGVINASDGIATLSGAFAGGASSALMESKDACLLVCLPTSTGTYKWVAIGLPSPLTGISETIQDVIGAMVTGNTETNVAVTYNDTTGKLDFVVSGVETIDSMGTLINSASAKATPVDADLVGFADTEDTNDLKKATWANIKAFLKTYFDTLYTAAAHDTATTGVHGVGGGTIAKTADIPVKASGAEVNTGTDDVKFVTAKAITDSELGALLNSINWQDWAPTFAGVPAIDSTVARYQRVGNSVRGYIDIRGSDGDGWTPSTCTLPVAPSDVNARVPANGEQKVNNGAATNMGAYIDAETNLNLKFERAAACTDAQPWHLYIWFEYEVAAA